MNKNIFILLILISEQIFARGHEPHRGEPRDLGPYAWGILIVLFSVVWWKLRKSGYKKSRKKNRKQEK